MLGLVVFVTWGLISIFIIGWFGAAGRKDKQDVCETCKNRHNLEDEELYANSVCSMCFRNNSYYKFDKTTILKKGDKK